MIDTWFGDEEASTLGFLHLPGDGGARGGVVVCSPLGYDRELAYRGLNLLGQRLAERSIATLRFDYLGEGDASGDTGSPDAPRRWLDTIVQAVAYLRASGIEQVAILAVGSGALLAAQVSAELGELAGVALWDPALSGRRFLRRQRSLYELAVGTNGEHPDGAPMICLELHPAAAEWLGTREIAPEWFAGVDSELLVLGRTADATTPAVLRMRDALGPRAEYRSIDGQEDWLDAPGTLKTFPLDTIGTVVSWFDERFTGPATPVSATTRHEAVVARGPGGEAVLERISRFGRHRLLAIETRLRTAAPGLVVLQPGAAEHRTGPGRFQVVVARELAARGYRAIRFDRSHTGDSVPVVPGEPNLIFADEWVDDADELVGHFAQAEPLALVGLCAGGWVSARLTERRPARLTVMMSPTYYKTRALEPDEYNRMTVTVRPPLLDKAKAIIRDHFPRWLWRAVARLQLFHDPGVLLAAPSGHPGSIVSLLLTPEDDVIFNHHRGPDAVARLTGHGADIRVTRYPFGDHSMFGLDVRTAMLADVMALVEDAMPVALAPDRSTALPR